METHRLENLKVEKLNLKVPPLQEIADVLSNGLAQHFIEVVVTVVECPDLTLPPYNLASRGLCGNPAIVQVGDPSNFILANFKHYDYRDVAKALGIDSALIFGAGGGCVLTCPYMIEIWNNVFIENNQVRNFSKDVFTKDKTLAGLTVKSVNVNETRFSVIGNLFACGGLPGKVIRISCKCRTGKDDFPTAIINSLNAVFADPIALGMVFTLKNGQAKVHVAPELLTKPLKSSSDLLNWVLLPIVSPPYTAVGTILTRNPVGWDLQSSHFHGCNEKEGGHYHTDVTPEIIEYEAYVLPAETLCSIDKAKKALSLFNYEL